MTDISNKKRKQNLQNLGISLDDPYCSLKLHYSLFKKGIPKFKECPKLTDFGLPYDAKEIIDTFDAKWAKKLKFIKLLVFLFVLLIVLYFLYIQTKSIGLTIFWGVFIEIVLFTPIIIILFNKFNSGPKETKEMKIKYKEYEMAVKAYEYWLEMGQLTFWNSLDGYQFEREVASFFRNQGYTATVTKGSGDGGVDVILTYLNEKIAVQCKAHSKPVGPAVVRDLYGTMTSGGYSKAILVSKSGFTKGVYEFAAGKPIELITVNDILSMVRNQ